jgi:exosortase/archaeosortase family protein
MNQNLKKLILKLAIFILVLTLFRFFINSFFANFNIYKSLFIPYTLRPLLSGMITRVGIIIVMAFILVNREKLLKLDIHKTKIKATLFFSVLTFFILVSYYIFRFFVNANLEFAMQYKWFFIILNYVFVFPFGLSLFTAVFGLQFIKDIYKNFKKQFKYFAIAAVVVYLLLVWVQSLWIYFSKGVGIVLYFIFSIFYKNVGLIYNTTGPLLSVEGFSATIGSPCSGVDSLLMFSGLFILIFLLDYKRLNKKMMLIFFPIGLLGTYAFNILRIFLLYLTGVYISPEFAVGLFHQNIGWILFIAYFFVFWWITSKYVYK